jgi:hypothetical protein
MSTKYSKDKTLQSMKAKKDEHIALTRDFLSEAFHLGCSPDEINKSLKEQLENENNPESE